MSTKSTVMMYVTSGVAGGVLAVIADYCHVPWYIRFPCYMAMGIVIALVWLSPKPRKDKQNERPN
jgi:hypothetical protein